jgi:DNA-directed RNA polymerase specialized sigma24 family protein
MAQFPTTRWSLIQASDRSQAEIVAAWRDLVRAYQPAVVGYFRRQATRQDADDLAQEFMLRSIEDGWWSRADPQAGSFRQFLRMLMKRFLANQMDAGYRRFERTGDTHEDVADLQTPDQYFDLQFALCLTRIALDDLRRDYESDGRGATFSALEPWLAEAPAYGELVGLGEQLDVSPNTLAVQLKRLRSRLQKAVRVAIKDLSLNDDCAATERDALYASLSESGMRQCD